jgi:hypothetical protein
MKYPIGTLLRITKVLYIHAIWNIGNIGIVNEKGILAIWIMKTGYDYIPEEQYLFEEV